MSSDQIRPAIPQSCSASSLDAGQHRSAHPRRLHRLRPDFLPEYKEYILDGKTVIASPHKIVGPESNDVVLQLRKRGISQVILAGMTANLCTEGHLRELVEQGFEVVVVRDATARPRLPEGDGYLAALINFRFLASAVWSTEQTVSQLRLF
ncbi:isochorismatase family protein [Streptomyces sp. NPDC004721]